MPLNALSVKLLITQFWEKVFFFLIVSARNLHVLVVFWLKAFVSACNLERWGFPMLSWSLGPLYVKGSFPIPVHTNPYSVYLRNVKDRCFLFSKIATKYYKGHARQGAAIKSIPSRLLLKYSVHVMQLEFLHFHGLLYMRVFRCVVSLNSKTFII